VIVARELERRFGSKRILRGLDLDVGERDFLVVSGPNGSGKSTLLGPVSYTKQTLPTILRV
jgi:multiple sugar transport system ATP-binding protein